MEKKKYKKLKRELDNIDNTIVDLETRLLLANETEQLKHLTKKILKNVEKEKIKLAVRLNESQSRIETIGYQLEWVDWVAKYNSKIDDIEQFKDPKQKKDYLEGLIERIDVSFDFETREHILKIKFKFPLVGDKLKPNDPKSSKKGYTIVNGSKTHKIPYSNSNSTTVGDYSTVTDLAKFRGLSTSLPRSTAA